MADKDDDQITITFEGKTYTLDDFEIGELEWLEEELGIYFNDIGRDEDTTRAIQSMKAASRLVLVLKRRDNPEFTLDEARKTKLRVFQAPPESNGNGNGSAKRRPTKRAATAR